MPFLGFRVLAWVVPSNERQSIPVLPVVLFLSRYFCESKMFPFLLSVLLFSFSLVQGSDFLCAEDESVCHARDERYSDYHCMRWLRGQIENELYASLTYMKMGIFFGMDHVNRLGASKFFFESASEEREHAKKLIKYLAMRGDRNTTFVAGMADTSRNSWPSLLSAFKETLDLERKVTSQIQDLIVKCSTRDDFHSTDYLTVDFLDEQLKGLRDISGKISNLKTMTRKFPGLGEFLFDMELRKE